MRFFHFFSNQIRYKTLRHCKILVSTFRALTIIFEGNRRNKHSLVKFKKWYKNDLIFKVISKFCKKLFINDIDSSSRSFTEFIVNKKKLRKYVNISNFMVVFVARDRVIGMKCPMFGQTELFESFSIN